MIKSRRVGLVRYGYVLLLIVIIFFATNCLAADSLEWGQPVNGLRMSVSATTEGGTVSQFRVTIQNVGDKDVSVRIGTMLGGTIDLVPTITISASDGKDWLMSHPDIPLGGRVFPIVVNLLSGASYTMVLAPTKMYLTLDGTHTLTKFMPRIDRVRAELNLQNANACRADEPGWGWVFPCWQGKVVSNRLDPWK